ncbi:MAG: hypothetical protein P8X57_13250 [Cyclobacteriaceae bacterium]
MGHSGYKLKLTSKRLKSGRCQIKFIISNKSREQECYGYLLADSGSTLRQVVERIEQRIRNLENPELFFHEHLYNLQERHESYKRKYPVST